MFFFKLYYYKGQLLYHHWQISPLTHLFYHIHPNCGWAPSWPWSYGSCIYNYLCNWCLSPLMLLVQLLLKARSTTLCDKVSQWLGAGRWFFPGPPVSSTNKTDRHDITEILLKVALSTINPTNQIVVHKKVGWMLYLSIIYGGTFTILLKYSYESTQNNRYFSHNMSIPIVYYNC